MRVKLNITKPKRMGRPPIAEGEETVMVHARLTLSQWAKYQALGGVTWLRERINKAKEPQ